MKKSPARKRIQDRPVIRGKTCAEGFRLSAVVRVDMHSRCGLVVRIIGAIASIAAISVRVVLWLHGKA